MVEEAREVRIAWEDLLQLVRIERGLSSIEMDSFKILLVDGQGVHHLTVVGCKPNYTEYITKAFARMAAVPLPPKPEKKNEEKTSDPDTPPDIRPAEDSQGVS